MAHINRRFIDKHWSVFLLRGLLAAIFGCFILFGGMTEISNTLQVNDKVSNTIVIIGVFLLIMGVVDAVGALYSSSKKRGWFNAVVDSVVDIVAAITLLFFASNNIVFSVIALSVYTITSGVIDVFHGFLSTVDPTDRFIRILAGVCGCVIGVTIFNSGSFEITTFLRFFGAYMLIVGVTSLIYGVHNRSQEIEDKVARKASAKKKK